MKREKLSERERQKSEINLSVSKFKHTGIQLQNFGPASCLSATQREKDKNKENQQIKAPFSHILNFNFHNKKYQTTKKFVKVANNINGREGAGEGETKREIEILFPPSKHILILTSLHYFSLSLSLSLSLFIL